MFNVILMIKINIIKICIYYIICLHVHRSMKDRSEKEEKKEKLYYSYANLTEMTTMKELQYNNNKQLINFWMHEAMLIKWDVTCLTLEDELSW